MLKVERLESQIFNSAQMLTTGHMIPLWTNSLCSLSLSWSETLKLGVSILPFSMILRLDFGTVPKVWHFFVFHFFCYLI